MSRVAERFMEYVKINTQSTEVPESAEMPQSVEAIGNTPSTEGQRVLARMLLQEMQDMGLQEIYYDREHCYLYASIPASAGCEGKKVLGLIAHMDTSPAVTGENVKPCIIGNYDGKDILLNQEQNIQLSPREFPELLNFKGKDLIVTDGTTLLGADDKAGIAEILSMAEYLVTNPKCVHGKIRIAFTPDEEIGNGVEHFDVERFGADIAYTVDGGELGELEYENFNAASLRVTIQGRNMHPGYAKGKMKNALLIAGEFQNMLPELESPLYTEGYEGFYHLESLSGTVEAAHAEYLIREHDSAKFENRKNYVRKCAEALNEKYGDGTIQVSIEDSYYNMKDIIEKNMDLIENAKQAMQQVGITPIIPPIRGGTDGVRLSFMGVPCPNLCTGAHNFHSRYEFVCIQDMEQITEMLVLLAGSF